MMKNWQGDRLAELRCLRSEDLLLERLAQTAAGLGFDFCAYGIQLPLPISRPSVVLINNYPKAWQQAYATKGYLHVDPTVRHGMRSCLPQVWSAADPAEAPAFWEEARAHDIVSGWAMSTRDGHGTVGMLTLARGGESIGADEMQAHQSELGWLAQYAHVAMCSILLPKYIRESNAELTEREKEVIMWTAEGKTAYEISQILDLSDRTVNFHINNVVMKLGAINKTQAAVKAAALGMLY